MEELILEASERTGKTKDIELVSGILYGDGIERALSVNFNRIALRKVISNHGAHAKVWVKYTDTKKFGFIKEVQRHPVTRDVSHIDVQIVSVDHEIKMQIPINFTGEEALKVRQLQLQIHKSDISVFGKMALIPESITVDVSEKELGDSITLENLNLDQKLTIEKADEIYGMIVHLKVQQAEEEAVVEVAEPKTATE